jgi:hypothetical protein
MNAGKSDFERLTSGLMGDYKIDWGKVKIESDEA